MKKHHLWGRKTPGPYTKLGNGIFDGAADTTSYLAGGAGQATGMLVGGAVSAYGGARDTASDVADSMLDGVEDFNEWAQGLSDSETGLYPYTRNDDLDG
ncbi:MAG: hypothetical protein ACR2QF_00925 [Geminicoccaceae bacterium]